MDQFLTQTLGSRSPCTMDQITGYGKVKFVGRGKACMPCKKHHIVFTHPISEPHAYGGSSEVVESPFLDTRSLEYLIELPSKVVYYL